MRERSLSMAGLERIPRVALAGSEMSITRTLSGAGCARGRQRNVRGRARRVVLRSGLLRGRSGRNRRHDQAARRTRRGGPRRHSGTGHHWPLLPPFGRGPLPPRRSRRCRSCDRESSRDVVPVNACAAVRVSPLWQALNDCVRTGRANAVEREQRPRETGILFIVGPRVAGKTTTAACYARTVVQLDRKAEAVAFRADPDAALRVGGARPARRVAVGAWRPGRRQAVHRFAARSRPFHRHGLGEERLRGRTLAGDRPPHASPDVRHDAARAARRVPPTRVSRPCLHGRRASARTGHTGPPRVPTIARTGDGCLTLAQRGDLGAVRAREGQAPD